MARSIDAIKLLIASDCEVRADPTRLPDEFGAPGRLRNPDFIRLRSANGIGASDFLEDALGRITSLPDKSGVPAPGWNAKFIGQQRTIVRNVRME